MNSWTTMRAVVPALPEPYLTAEALQKRFQDAGFGACLIPTEQQTKGEPKSLWQILFG